MFFKKKEPPVEPRLVRAVSIQEQKVEAKRFLDSDVMSIILDTMRSEALESLAKGTDSKDANEIVRLQSAVATVDGFRLICRRMITRADEESKKKVDPI